MFIRTPNLFLRPVFAEDWRALYCGIADRRVVSMLASAPWPYRPEHARDFCRRPLPRGAMRFAITLPQVQNCPLAGMIGLDAPGGKSAGHELGYWVARQWQGRGIASEAVAGVLEIARAIGIERVEAGHFVDNPASGRVLRRAGFAETGEVRPTPSAGRGGKSVLARRYAIALGVQQVSTPGLAAA